MTQQAQRIQYFGKNGDFVLTVHTDKKGGIVHMIDNGVAINCGLGMTSIFNLVQAGTLAKVGLGLTDKEVLRFIGNYELQDPIVSVRW